uniref:SAP domain-containing ribonucleoprotein n=1 Tax=Salvator merianae TaxID=96440 RepID=A0A8D0DLC7_SALMN
MAAETVELHKLKLAELKQECLARGLEVKGNKQDLINRLQTYLEQHAEEEANEEDVLGEETEEEEQKPIDTPVKEEVATEKSAEVSTEKKVVKITSEIPQMERMQKRAERFNVPVSLESKKAARAARFGIPTASTKGLAPEGKTTVNIDKLKERAQRFGLNVSTASKKIMEFGKSSYIPAIYTVAGWITAGYCKSWLNQKEGLKPAVTK